MNKICDECETVAHCTKHGCIPKVSAKDAMKLALEALEGSTDKTLSIRAITALREALAEQPAQQQEPVAFLANGTRFKISYDSRQSVGQIHGIPPELGGRWVAFVAADDDCHLKLTSPQPAQQKPVTHQYQNRDGVWKDFISEKHYKDTLEDGSWPIRNLYTSPPAQRTPFAYVWTNSKGQAAYGPVPHDIYPSEPLYKAPQPAQQQEPIYQYQMANGSWIDQTKKSHDYNVRHGQATVRVVYAAPQPAQQELVNQRAHEMALRQLLDVADLRSGKANQGEHMKTVIEMAKEAGFACESDGEIYIDHRDGVCTKNLNSFAELVRADEREACAEECDEWIKNGSALAEDIAAAIRARSNT